MYAVTAYRFAIAFFGYLIIQQNIFNVKGDNQNKQLFTNCVDRDIESNIYDYSSYDINDDKKQSPISFSKYRGKTLLIVITATYCKYTEQYPYLNELKNSYTSNNFEILAFPCNQFGLQEPGVTGTEILNGIRFVRPGNNYVPNFPMFERSDVNGYGERPLFTFLKFLCPSPIDEFHPWPNITYSPMRSNDLRWNFEKFLIDANGRPVKRFASGVTPAQLLPHIDEVMAISTSKTRHDKISSLSRQLNHLYSDDINF